MRRLASIVVVWLGLLSFVMAGPPTIGPIPPIPLAIRRTDALIVMTSADFAARRPFGDEPTMTLSRTEYDRLVARAGPNPTGPRPIIAARYEATLEDDGTLVGQAEWSLAPAIDDRPVLLHPLTSALRGMVTDDHGRRVAVEVNDTASLALVARPARDANRLKTEWSTRSRTVSSNVRRFEWEWPIGADAQLTIRHAPTIRIEPDDSLISTTVDHSSTGQRLTTIRFTGGRTIALQARRIDQASTRNDRPTRVLVRRSMRPDGWGASDRFEWTEPTSSTEIRFQLPASFRLTAVRSSDRNALIECDSTTVRVKPIRPLSWIEIDGVASDPMAAVEALVGPPRDEMLSIDLPAERELDIDNDGDFRLDDVRKDDDDRTTYQWRPAFVEHSPPAKRRRPKWNSIARDADVQITERGTFGVRGDRLRLDLTVRLRALRGPLDRFEFRWPRGYTLDGDEIETAIPEAIRTLTASDSTNVVLPIPMASGDSRTFRVALSRPILTFGPSFRAVVPGLLWSGHVRRNGQITVTAVLPWKTMSPLVVVYQNGPPVAEAALQRIDFPKNSPTVPPIRDEQSEPSQLGHPSPLHRSLVGVSPESWIVRERSGQAISNPVHRGESIREWRSDGHRRERFDAPTLALVGDERIVAIARRQPWLGIQRIEIDPAITFDSTECGGRWGSTVITVNRSLFATFSLALLAIAVLILPQSRVAWAVLIVGILGIGVAISWGVAAAIVALSLIRMINLRRFASYRFVGSIVGVAVIANSASTNDFGSVEAIILRDPGREDRVVVPVSVGRMLIASAPRDTIRWESADIRGDERDDDAIWSVRWYGSADRPGPLALPMSDLRLETMTIDGRPAYPTKQDNGLSIDLPTAGSFVLEANFRTTVRDLGLERESSWSGPAVPRSKIRFGSERHARNLVIASRSGMQRTNATERSVDADHGATGLVSVRWRDSKRSTIGIESTRECSQWEFADGTARLTTAILFPKVRQYDPKFEVAIPDDLELQRAVGRSPAGDPIPCEIGPTANGRVIVSFRTIVDGRPTALLTLVPRDPSRTRQRLIVPSAVVHPDPDAIVGVAEHSSSDIRIAAETQLAAVSPGSANRIAESLGLAPRPFEFAYRRTAPDATAAIIVGDRPATQVRQDRQLWLVGPDRTVQGEWTIDARGPQFLRVPIPHGLRIVSCQASPSGTMECRMAKGELRMLVTGPPDPPGPIVVRWEAVMESPADQLPIVRWPGSKVVPVVEIRALSGWAVDGPGPLPTDAKSATIRVERKP